MSVKYECADFSQFQEQLRKMRDLDDKIIYALNTSLPTESFKGQVNAEAKCRDLHVQLESGYTHRQEAIKNCIVLCADTVKTLKEQREDNRDDVSLNKQFKTEQRKLRLLQAELSVEDIIRERTQKTFRERCRLFFRFDSM
ncbi:coiled-coil domain-containing protein 58-like [Anopheles albimanus]|uniref:Protein MIX23 n=1 Tax=Anopheles albimanus TaxID=7167 RepID=A0A182FE63_ANOAL|nr:coiled-coil domain-containing protein 58-like [Anopheles albimanus]